MTNERIRDVQLAEYRRWGEEDRTMSVHSRHFTSLVDEIDVLRERLTKINDNWPDVMAVERLTAENARLMHDIAAGSAEIERLNKELGDWKMSTISNSNIPPGVEPTPAQCTCEVSSDSQSIQCTVYADCPVHGANPRLPRVGDIVSIKPVVGCPRLPTEGWVVDDVIHKPPEYSLSLPDGTAVYVEEDGLAVNRGADT